VNQSYVSGTQTVLICVKSDAFRHNLNCSQLILLLYLWLKCGVVIGSNRVTWC